MSYSPTRNKRPHRDKSRFLVFRRRFDEWHHADWEPRHGEHGIPYDSVMPAALNFKKSAFIGSVKLMFCLEPMADNTPC